MTVVTTVERKFNYTPDDIKELIIQDIKAQHGLTLSPKEVTFSIYEGDAGGYGSMGDPMHVYNPPTPSQFTGAKAVVVTTE